MYKHVAPTPLDAGGVWSN